MRVVSGCQCCLTSAPCLAQVALVGHFFIRIESGCQSVLPASGCSETCSICTAAAWHLLAFTVQPMGPSFYAACKCCGGGFVRRQKVGGLQNFGPDCTAGCHELCVPRDPCLSARGTANACCSTPCCWYTHTDFDVLGPESSTYMCCALLDGPPCNHTVACPVKLPLAQQGDPISCTPLPSPLSS